MLTWLKADQLTADIMHAEAIRQLNMGSEKGAKPSHESYTEVSTALDDPKTYSGVISVCNAYSLLLLSILFLFITSTA